MQMFENMISILDEMKREFGFTITDTDHNDVVLAAVSFNGLMYE